MSDPNHHGQLGRINALAYAIYKARGYFDELKRRSLFLPLDLTESEMREAVDMAQWFTTDAGQESLAMVRELQARANEERR